MKLCRDCGDLPPKISALADQYKEVWVYPVCSTCDMYWVLQLVTTHHNKDMEVITSEHQAIRSEVEVCTLCNSCDLAYCDVTVYSTICIVYGSVLM